ncbi:MAG: DUF3880 domain-containing protein, partial [Lachnospiraceae bacterium]|nr:DUF3880 domain-containing protein [Lachnospiraceae bacterium]
MKILFYRYRNICESEIAVTFSELGIESVELMMGANDLNELTRIKESIESHNPDCIFSIDFFPLISDICNIYHIRYVSWIVDCPVMELFFKQISNKWNRVFIFDRAQYEDVKKFNPENIFYFPLAAGINKNKKIFDNLSATDSAKFSHDISFVGSLYTEKCFYDNKRGLNPHDEGYLEGIMKAQERIYGAWIIDDLLDDRIVREFKKHHLSFYELDGESYLTDKITMSQLYIGSKISAMERVDTMKALSDRFTVNLYTMSDTSELKKIKNMGPANSVTEMPLIFRNSKINLNITSKSIRTGLPQRIFDIMSSGGFVLSNYQEEIGELFEIGNEIAVYESIDDLIYKSD